MINRKKIFTLLFATIFFLISVSNIVLAESEQNGPNLVPPDMTVTQPSGETLDDSRLGDHLELFTQCDENNISTNGLNTSGQLSPAGHKLYDAIRSHEGTSIVVDFTDLSVNADTLDELIQNVAKYDRLAFEVSGYNAYSYRSYSSNNNLVSVSLFFSIDGSLFSQRYQDMQKETIKALQSVNNSMTNEEKALALHDYLAENIVYDYDYSTGPDQYLAYGALVNHECVCDGYTRAYNLLLSYCGIPGIRVTSESMNHAWSMIELANNWYHVDITWDDPENTSINSPYYTRYENFLRNDNGITQTNHSNWNSEGIISNSELYESKPMNSNMVQGYYNGKWYVISNGSIFTQNMDGSESKSFKGNLDIVSIAVVNNFLYYPLGQSIYQINLDTNEEKQVYTLKQNELGSIRPELTSINYVIQSDLNDLSYFYFTFDGEPTANGYISGTMHSGTTSCITNDSKITKIELSRSSALLDVGDTSTLYIQKSPTFALSENVVWESSNPSIATVEKGTITALSPGSTTITAKSNGLVSTCLITVTGTPSFILGDVNNDSKINSIDALKDLQSSVQLITLSSDEFTRGDVNKDKKINSLDALKILQYSVSIINSFET